MLRLLLDEHVSRQVAEPARLRAPTPDIRSIHGWESGAYLGVPDPQILIEAGRQRLTLVTYDQRTLWWHAADVMESGREHGGVILVDEQTIPPNDIGGLMRSLVWLWETRGQEQWQNRLIFLTPAPAPGTPIVAQAPRGPRRRGKRT
jgi:hypothetical protein